MSIMRIRHTLLAPIYALMLGIAGLGFLIAVTDPELVRANLLPLAAFAALSFMLKRAGFHVAPEVTHSLVGIIDLSAVFIFGPILGAWVAASSGFTYLFLNAWRREKHTLANLFEIPLFNAGLKVGMAYSSSHLFIAFGGTYAPRTFDLFGIWPYLAAALAWFIVDHVGWGLLEYLRGGSVAVSSFLRAIVLYSLLMELLPLPFAVVIAIVYVSLDHGVFAILALALFGTAVVVQRFADASTHLERRRNELSVLNEFSHALAQAGFDADKIVDLLCAHARRIVPADLCRIELFEADRKAELGALLAVEATTAETRHPNQPTPSPLREYLTAHREPIRAADLSQPLVYPPEATGTAVGLGEQVRIDDRAPRSLLIVPMFAGEEPIGAVSLLAIRPDAFFPIHERNLSSMAGQAAVALQNARLYTTERKRATQLGIVSEVGRQVATILDIDELLAQVVKGIRERFGYSKVHLFTVDSDSSYVVFRASTDPRGAEWRERGWKLRFGLEGIVGWVAALGEPRVVPDVQQEPRFILDPDETETETRSEVAVPLVVGKDTVGVLDVQSNKVNAFGDEDLFILNTLAAQVAIAIEDAKLFNLQKEEAWYLNVMLQVAENLSATTSLDESLETVVRITPLLVGVARCAIMLYDATSESFVPAKSYGLAEEQEQTLATLKFRADDHRALSQVREELAPVVVDDSLSSDLIRPDIRELFGIRAMLIAPLMTRGELVGAMLVDQGTRARQFSQHEIQVVMGIANQTAVAIEGARLTTEAEAKKRYEYELGVAQQIQKSFLPDACPVLPDYEICSMWQPAREVGGDFYDFIPLPGGRLGIVIADVADKGIAAALFMALARTIIRTMAIGKPTPHEALDRANDVMLSDARADMFVTVFFTVLDPLGGHLTFANAGHNPPLVYRAATGEVTTLKGHGIAMGVVPNISLEDYSLDLDPGDLLLLYTDGVTEAFNAQEEEFGAERLACILAAGGQMSADGVIGEITKAVAEFTGNKMNADDLTMVAIRRSPIHRGEPLADPIRVETQDHTVVSAV